MDSVHGPRGLGGAAPKIAIGAAIAAVLMSLLAVIVVSTRGGAAGGAAGAGGTREGDASASAGEGAEGEGAGAAVVPPPSGKRIAATDVLRLRRDVVVVVRDAGKALGVRVTDEELRQALDLGPDDVITAISGRAIEREYDLFDVMLAVKRLRAQALYVDLLREGKPLLVRWQLDGDLQTARAPDPADPRGLGSGGSLGTGGVLGPNPFMPVTPDPLVDTIKKLDDLSYEVPRATIEKVFTSPAAYARVARTLPARRTTGFQVFLIRPGSIVAAIGLSSGDTIRAINGNAVNSIDEVIELYPQIKDAAEWRVDLDRRGKPALLKIAIK
ncbi:MAG TPA: hypothetical protein VNO30_42495 [Kofleriaceae bacterium]|nr:hypothetical protein [Kofleriaceae bacterium]